MTDTTRYEFRCWPQSAAALARAVEDRYHFAGEEACTDTYYLVPDRHDVVPKLSGGKHFKIKTLDRVEDGLECWRTTDSDIPGDQPVAPDRFPGLENASAPCAVWKTRRVYKEPRLRIAVERAESGSRHRTTIAFESPDPERIKREIEALGLLGLENVNYSEALRRPDVLG